MTTAPASLVAEAGYQHRQLIAADEDCKLHASVRNAALVRLRVEYGCEPDEIARLTGVPERTIRNILFREKAKVS